MNGQISSESLCTLWLRNDWIISAFRVINRLPKEKHRRSKPYENTEIRD
nr:MAG TPA: hypothetical protein [Caudoviricetes sp.]